MANKAQIKGSLGRERPRTAHQELLAPFMESTPLSEGESGQIPETEKITIPSDNQAPGSQTPGLEKGHQEENPVQIDININHQTSETSLPQKFDQEKTLIEEQYRFGTAGRKLAEDYIEKYLIESAQSLITTKNGKLQKTKKADTYTPHTFYLNKGTNERMVSFLNENGVDKSTFINIAIRFLLEHLQSVELSHEASNNNH